MLKNKSVLLGIAIIVIVVLATTGCVFYNLLKPEDFKKTMGDRGYEVVEGKKGEYEAQTYLEASKEGVPYVISYYRFEKEIDAQKAYQSYKNNLVRYITKDSKNTETTGAIRAKLVAVSAAEYIVVSRVKNTLLFIPGTIDAKDDINNLLDSIKY